MLTPELRASGWREMPDEATQRKWSDAGGRWQGIYLNAHGYTSPLPVETMGTERCVAARPVNPATWDFDPRGWGESLVPTSPGLWWRDDLDAPVLVSRSATGGVLYWQASGMPEMGVEDDGMWLGKCVKPGGDR